MIVADERSLQFDVGERLGNVSALLNLPDHPRALYLLAHGAGAGMRHAFLEATAHGLALRGIGTLRYQFPYMEAQRQRPDPPAVAVATVRGAVRAAQEAAPGLPLIAGGKSFGGRMTSTAQSAEALSGVRGLAFLGFPLHAPGKPSASRADHLERVTVPMLFLQGTRDEFADLELLRGVCDRLGSHARLHLIESGDHSFRVPKKAGKTGPEVMDELFDTIAGWTLEVI